MAVHRRPKPPRPLPGTTHRPVVRLPSMGGPKGYCVVFQEYVCGLVQTPTQHVDPLRYEMLRNEAQLRGQQTRFPCISTVKRWMRSYRVHGHCQPLVMQGNRRASVLRGEATFRLALWRLLYPRANAYETNAFLWNTSPDPPGVRRLYLPSRITEAEDRLGLSRKVSSTTARQASCPRI